MTPTILIILSLLGFVTLGVAVLSKNPVFSITSAALFFFISGSLFVSGLEEVTGRNITENVTSENISMIEEVYVKSNVQGLDTGLLGILFASLGIFMTAASVVGVKG